jgi:hypothetical protein
MSQGGTQSQSLQLRRTVARDKMSDSNFLFPTFTVQSRSNRLVKNLLMFPNFWMRKMNVDCKEFNFQNVNDWACASADNIIIMD